MIATAAFPEELEEEPPPPGPRLAHDLLVYGLPAREASRLRDALARTGIPLDLDADETSVLVPCKAPRPVSLESVLAVVRAQAERRRFAQLPIVYGTREYVLALGRRDAEPEGDGPHDAQRPI